MDLYLTETRAFWDGQFPEQLHMYDLKPIPRLYSFLPFDLAKKRIDYRWPKGFPKDVEEYDLAVDFNSYQCSCAVGALTVPAKKRVMWIHNDVGIKLHDEWKYRVLWHFFRGKFKYYDGFVGVSAALEEPFRIASGVEDKPFSAIPNYIDVGEIRQKMAETPGDLEIDPACMNFVALGRLCHQKGYDLMLQSFAEARKQREDLRLYIIGDGPDRGALESLTEELKLREDVHFLGSQPNPFQYMARMDAFVSSSRYEGQGMNIMEAMAVGLPLFCTKNLEKYIEGLQGCEDLTAALIAAKKTEKRPDDLAAYNGRILDRIAALAGE